jgi:opacity protein-like surface antigen
LASDAICSEKQRAFRFAYDYHFSRIWGLEISFGDLAKAEANGTSTATGYQGAWKMKANGWAIAGTVTVPMGGGFSLLGKIGAVRAVFDESYTTYCDTCGGDPGEYHARDPFRIIDAKTALTYGLGLQYDFNDTYAIRTQYENFGKYNLVSPLDGSTLNMRLTQVSAGIVLKF